MTRQRWVVGVAALVAVGLLVFHGSEPMKAADADAGTFPEKAALKVTMNGQPHHSEYIDRPNLEPFQKK